MLRNGIHHVTAIAGPAQRNFDFYTRVLGLRLVKKTVNFDDPGTYHFYYGDEAGQPGTILTFFPWEHAAPGRLGTGETQETVFRVPEGAIGYWLDRLVAKGVPHEAPQKRFGETVVSFKDPDGMRLALVAVSGIEGETAWTTGEIPAELAIRGFHGASLLVAKAAPTGAILTDIFGFTKIASEGSVVRYKAGGTSLGGIIDLQEAGEAARGRSGAGTVHHIAFRAASDAVQAEMVRKLAENHGIRATEQKNRDYFRAVYFREPGGILFEIATDDPGFAGDEPVESLGQALKLPRFLEPNRAKIEAVLPKVAWLDVNLSCRPLRFGGRRLSHSASPGLQTLIEVPMTTTTELSFIHCFKPATELGKLPILLLHGTGGKEDDLLPLGAMIAPGSALLSPRGKVLEGGMPRFFRRLHEGVFDEDDVRRRANELADFIAEARESYNLMVPVAVGFSNGANIAAAVLQLRPEALAGAVLLRAMVPLQNPPAPDLTGKPVLIVSGASDPIVPADDAKRLASLLIESGASVSTRFCRRDMGCRRPTSPSRRPGSTNSNALCRAGLRARPIRTPDHATHRHPSSHRRHRQRPGQPRLLHQHARPAPGEEDRQPGRRQRVSPVLCRRARLTRPDITFFDWPVERERRGTHSITRTGMRVAGADGLAWWRRRFQELGVSHFDVVERDGRLTLDFEDFEGQRLSLIDDGGQGEAAHPWERSPVPAEHQIRGLGPITISVPDLQGTELVLTKIMGMSRVRDYATPGNEETRTYVYQMGPGGAAAELHVSVEPNLPIAQPGAGGVHHVAFRIPDADYQAWAQRLNQVRMPSSGPVDRFWFRSLYFREPNGILFEIATDGPGFATDEPMDMLGVTLSLPPFLEGRRPQIEAGLKPL